MPPSAAARLLVLTLPLLPAGCGPAAVEGTAPTGVLTRDGAAYPVRPGETFDLEFAAVGPDGAAGAVFRADVDRATSAFELTGPQSRGVPAGRYRVRVRHADEGGRSLLPAALGDADTPLEVEIGPNTGEIRVDLGKTAGVSVGPPR